MDFRTAATSASSAAMHRWVWLLVLAIGCTSEGPTKRTDGDGLSHKSTSAEAASSRRLIMLTNGDDPYWDAMRLGMKDAELEFKLADAGLRAELDKNENGSKGQIDKLAQYAGQNDIAAVAISVTDNQNVALFEAMRTLRAQGVNVITIDSDVDREKARDARFAYLGTDNIIAGGELGRAAKGLLPDGAKYAAFVGIKTTANAQERITGFANAAGEKFTQTDFLGDEMDRSVAQKNVLDALNREPGIGLLVGIWAYNAHAIVQTVTDRDLRKQMAIVNFDADPQALQHMQNGMIDALVVQNPYEMGRLGTRLLKALVLSDNDTIRQMYPSYETDEQTFTKADGDLLVTGLKVVVPDGDKRLKKEMFEPTTEFLPLSEFKAWLDKNKLSGS